MTTSIYNASKEERYKHFINRSKEIHGSKYDYSKVIYTTNSDKVEIICREHGSFIQAPIKHTIGRGCPECAKINRIKNKTKDTEWFITNAIKVHNDKYDYSMSKYKKAKYKVDIICSSHGIFNQRPDAHLRGQGCPLCKAERSFGWYIKQDSIDSNEICQLYNIKITGNGETFYKLGISKNIFARFNEIRKDTYKKYKIEVISLLTDTRYNCYKLEQKLLNKYRRKGIMYSPSIKFPGQTECYII